MSAWSISNTAASTCCRMMVVSPGPPRGWLHRFSNLWRRPRPVLVHAHLFKNAGTTFDWSLARSFGEGFVDHREDDLMKQGAAYLGPWLEQHTHCNALSSHWITPPLPDSPHLRPLLCLLFRDPVERMHSVYQFERRQQGVDTPGSNRAKQLSFVDYMRWQMEPMPGPVVKNYLTRVCSGDYLGQDLDTMFQRAAELVRLAPALGLVHRYDESMVLFEHCLQPWFPQLDLSYISQNVLSGEDRSMVQRRQLVLEMLAELGAEVLAANEYDIQLFSLAEQRFETLIGQVPDFEARLASLRQRNERLLEQAG